MKVYQLTFMDAERGKIVQWKRNKRQCARLTKEWAVRYPLRKLMLQEHITIPSDRNKDGLIEWLNENCGGL